MKIFSHFEDRARSRIQIVLLFGFGALVGLIGFAGFSALQRAGKSYSDIERLHEADRMAERIAAEIRSNLQFAAISNRDYLLDPDADRPAAIRRTAELRTAVGASLDQLEPLARDDDKINIRTMRMQLVEY